MTQDKKKLAILIGVVIGLIIIFAGGFKIYRSIQENSYEKGKKQELYDTIAVGAKDLGITDLTNIKVETAKDDNGQENSYLVAYAESEQFASLTQQEMVDFFFNLNADAEKYNPELSYMAKCIMYTENNDGLRIISGGHEYMCKYYSGDISWILYEDGVEVFVYDPRKPVNQPDSGSDGEKCTVCNGTGSVKYYYGASDLEALIDGHEASWYGQCGTCQGTGVR